MTDDIRSDVPTEGLTLVTSDGVELEAEARFPVGATVGVVLTHPHPLFGGSMRSLVTSELFRAAPAHGLAVLRFNFRGVEGSGGEHGAGRDEAHDVVAALDALATRLPGAPIVVAGWSFGADVALSVLDERIAGWFLVAPPMRILSLDELRGAHDPRPKLLVVPEHDEFNPPERASTTSADWVATDLEVVRGADHYLAGRTTAVMEHLARFADDLAG